MRYPTSSNSKILEDIVNLRNIPTIFWLIYMGESG